MTDKYIQIPIEVLHDRRLTLTDLRVLMCLFSHFDMDTRKPFLLGKASIQDKTGLHMHKITLALKKLRKIGWITRTPSVGGRGRPNQYMIQWDGHTLTETDDEHALRRSVAYQTWRKEVFKRDGYACRNCGDTFSSLEAHHVKSFALHPDLRLDVSNGRTLCKRCHHKETAKQNQIGTGLTRQWLPPRNAATVGACVITTTTHYQMRR